MTGDVAMRYAVLRIAYPAALVLSALSVIAVIWQAGRSYGLMDGIAKTALLLSVPMAPGTFTLIGGGAMAAYGLDAPRPFKWVAIIGSVWAAFLAWRFINL